MTTKKAQSRASAMASLRRSRSLLRRLIDQNEWLREFPGHEASAETRIVEGETELAVVESQLDEIERRREEDE